MPPAWGVGNVQTTMKVDWKGVFPAITTQFRQDQSLDLAATAKHLETMIAAGIHGVVLLGTVGENTALEYQEKLAVLREMKQVVRGRIPRADRRGRIHHARWPAASRAMRRRSASMA